jgi:hypothetical protein
MTFTEQCCELFALRDFTVKIGQSRFGQLSLKYVLMHLTRCATISAYSGEFGQQSAAKGVISAAVPAGKRPVFERALGQVLLLCHRLFFLVKRCSSTSHRFFGVEFDFISNDRKTPSFRAGWMSSKPPEDITATKKPQDIDFSPPDSYILIR